MVCIHYLMFSHYGTVSTSLETRVAKYCKQMKLVQGLGYLLRAQIVYEHCTSHDRIFVREQRPS